MTDPLDIACAMVALPGWRWLCAMVLPDDRIVTGVGDVWIRVQDRNGTVHRVWTRDPSDPPDVGPLPDLTSGATLGIVEHGILAPAGVWVERVDLSLSVHYRARSRDDRARRNLSGASRPTLPEALLDGLRVVR